MEILRIVIPRTIVATNIVIMVRTAGGTLTSAKNAAGLYVGSTDNGTLGAKIGVTADQSTVWNSTGEKVMAMTSGPFTIQGGPNSWVYGAILCTGTTPIKCPAFNGITDANVNNLGMSKPPYRSAFSSGVTAIPAATLPALSAAGKGFWMAIS